MDTLTRTTCQEIRAGDQVCTHTVGDGDDGDNTVPDILGPILAIRVPPDRGDGRPVARDVGHNISRDDIVKFEMHTQGDLSPMELAEDEEKENQELKLGVYNRIMTIR